MCIRVWSAHTHCLDWWDKKKSTIKRFSAESVETCGEKQHALCVYLSNQRRETGWGDTGSSWCWCESRNQHNLVVVQYTYFVLLNISRPFLTGKKPRFKNLVEMRSPQEVKMDPYSFGHGRFHFDITLTQIFWPSRKLGSFFFAPPASCKFSLTHVFSDTYICITYANGILQWRECLHFKDGWSQWYFKQLFLLTLAFSVSCLIPFSYLMSVF